MSSLIDTEKFPLGIDVGSTRTVRRRHPRRATPYVGLTGTLRGRLVAILMLTNLFALAMTGSVIVLKARTASQVEIDSSMRLAGLLVTDTIRLMNDAPNDLLLQTVALQFRAVRHARIVVTDGDGGAVVAADHASVVPEDAPAWFAYLVAPPPRTEVVPILRHDRLVGKATIFAQPADEISEAWNYAEPLFVVGSMLDMAALVAMFLLFGRVLAPLAALAQGLDALQSKRYGVRLPLPGLHELANLTDHFNRTAEALAHTSEHNRSLHRKLLTAQDDERRRMALELHDEVGPCLFALDVNASSIVSSTEGRVHDRATRVVDLVRQVQGINRRVLDQLRPIGLGDKALRECLDKLLLEFVDGAHVAIEPSFGPIADSYGPVVDLTVYRCVQEGLFNAVRHARATRITCEVEDVQDAAAGRFLRVRVRDDGTGLPDSQRAGIGLAGMRGRVEALNGTLDLETSGKGTRLTIRLPIIGEGDVR